MQEWGTGDCLPRGYAPRPELKQQHHVEHEGLGREMHEWWTSAVRSLP